MSLMNSVKPTLMRMGSMPLAILLLVVLALASVIGTVLLQNQDQTDYLQQFGPLWYWVFRSLGLFDMYHAWWFLSLLGFLMLSLSVCLWRNVPRMLKEMRTHKVPLKEGAWERMGHQHAWTVEEGSADELAARIRKRLHMLKWRQEKVGDTVYLRGDKGRFHKSGYILVHSALLIILIGGWMSVQFGFRGNMSVPEGAKESEIAFLKGTSTEYQKMPFEVRCNKFSIDFYPNGMPKEFLSNLTIIDDGKEVLTSDIIVNKPLYYKGVRIYQASFGDGGSEVKLKRFFLDGSKRTDVIGGKVYQKWVDERTGMSIEFKDFKPFNVENLANPGEPKKFHNLGPAAEFVLRGPGLKPVLIKSFMNPFEVNGDNQGSFMMISLTGDAKEYQTFFLGLDLTQPKEWDLYHAFVRNINNAGKGNDPQANLAAFRSAMQEIYGDERPANFQQMGLRMIQSVQMLPNLPWPFIPVLEDFDQVYYTGLQLARDPGMNVVWIGSALLVFGLCIMFYVSHRRIWVVLRPEAGKVSARVAGSSNRNPMVFEREFQHFLILLDGASHVSPQGGKA